MHVHVCILVTVDGYIKFGFHSYKKCLALYQQCSTCHYVSVHTCRVSGYLFRRVSRTAAFLVGCSFLALQVRSWKLVTNIKGNWLFNHRGPQLWVLSM